MKIEYTLIIVGFYILVAVYLMAVFFLRRKLDRQCELRAFFSPIALAIMAACTLLFAIFTIACSTTDDYPVSLVVLGTTFLPIAALQWFASWRVYLKDGEIIYYNGWWRKKVYKCEDIDTDVINGHYYFYIDGKKIFRITYDIKGDADKIYYRVNKARREKLKKMDTEILSDEKDGNN